MWFMTHEDVLFYITELYKVHVHVHVYVHVVTCTVCIGDELFHLLQVFHVLVFDLLTS